MINISGIAPENLPTPEKSLKEIKKEELKKISGGARLKTLFKKYIKLNQRNKIVY